jgi:hypothetical protein
VPTKEDSDIVTCILTLAKFYNREIVRSVFNIGKLKGKSSFYFSLKEHSELCIRVLASHD